jgi:outer membrane protein, heavy metal efflux system
MRNYRSVTAIKKYPENIFLKFFQGWHPSNFLLTGLLIMGCFIPGLLWGEEIDLDQALSLFYKNNYDILINRYEIDKAQADLIGVKVLPNPNFTFNYTGLEVQTAPQAGDNTQMILRLDQLVELGGKRRLRTSAAQETLEAAKLGHKDTIRTLLIGFYTLFYNLKLDALNSELANEELKRYDRTLEIAEKRFNAGHLSLVDYTKIKIARTDLENNLTNLENQLNNENEQFSFLVGSNKPLKPAIHISESFPEYREEGLIGTAYENRYDLLSLQKQLKAAEYSGALAKSGRIPDITIGAEYDSYGAENKPAIGFGFSIPIPLFNRNQGDILRKRAEYKQLEFQLEKLKKQIVVDVRQAINNFKQSLRVLESYKGRQGDISELLNRSEKAFSFGGITVLDLLDTQKTHRDFTTKYNQALVQSNLSERLIKIYTGELK